LIYTEGDDPIEISMVDPWSLANWQSIEIQGRADNYNTGPITAWDQAAIEEFGLRVGSTISAHEICDLAVAQIVAQLILQRQVYIRRHYTLKLSEVFCLLEAMDLIEITDPALGPNPVTIRITEVDEDDNGDLTITAEEFPQSGDPNWGGAVAYASLDGVSYSQVATIPAAAKQGVTTAALAAYTGVNPDTADTLAVDLTSSGGVLDSTSAAAAAQGVTLCYVGGEFLSYTVATLTAANKFNLTSLYRGLDGVASVASPSGTPFCLLDNAILKYTVPNAEIGDLIYLKFASYNTSNQQLEDLSSCTQYTYVISGTGTLGPVSSALAIGTSMDFGYVAGDAISEDDDWGTVTSSVTSVIDLGNCTL
jgi:hypothetical protein